MHVNQPKEGGAELNPASISKPEIRERPILFNDAMVRAILDGRKTVTRRQITPQFPSSVKEVLPYVAHRDTWMPSDPESPDEAWEEQVRVCPYGKPGDRLWVRETFAVYGDENFAAIHYRADRPHDVGRKGVGYKPSIHMPRWACRILLEITNVRVERLQDITEEQAEAEGVRACEHDLDPDGNGYSATELLSILWSSLYGVDSYNANPWVWVVEFKRVEVANVQ
jgi:hypothetical protein